MFLNFHIRRNKVTCFFNEILNAYLHVIVHSVQRVKQAGLFRSIILSICLSEELSVYSAFVPMASLGVFRML